MIIMMQSNWDMCVCVRIALAQEVHSHEQQTNVAAVIERRSTYSLASTNADRARDEDDYHRRRRAD